MAGEVWVKVAVTWADSEWLDAIDPAARYAWIRLLGHVKANGYGGRTKALTAAKCARLWSVDREHAAAMLSAAAADGAIATEDGQWVVRNWAKYQGDPTAAERVRKSREKRAAVTDVTRKRRNVTLEQSRAEQNRAEQRTAAEAAAAEPRSEPPDDPPTDQEAVSEIIRRANRVMSETLGDACRPIPISHGSRQEVIDWLAEGIPADAVLSVIEAKVRAYRPTQRSPNPSSMKYFDGAVRDAWDRRHQSTGNGAAPSAPRDDYDMSWAEGLH